MSGVCIGPTFQGPSDDIRSLMMMMMMMMMMMRTTTTTTTTTMTEMVLEMSVQYRHLMWLIA
jgi:hypothetical protein